ncbi:hypothetical protein JOB18_048148 [Solea senegalensis]|uniref:Uncharacterized protein n=1 Tax=Solea senegalensis TaxID=28829 RepID=A0AAV6SJE9_SOLSE|nr:hypothetical protein JOB18_048148 [Solea senegalensis]
MEARKGLDEGSQEEVRVDKKKTDMKTGRHTVRLFAVPSINVTALIIIQLNLNQVKFVTTYHYKSPCVVTEVEQEHKIPQNDLLMYATEVREMKDKRHFRMSDTHASVLKVVEVTDLLKRMVNFRLNDAH